MSQAMVECSISGSVLRIRACMDYFKYLFLDAGKDQKST